MRKTSFYRSSFIPGSSTNYIVSNLYQQFAPNRIILGLLDQNQYMGEYSSNPLCFKNHGVQKVSLLIDNEEYESVEVSSWSEGTGNAYMGAYQQLMVKIID